MTNTFASGNYNKWDNFVKKLNNLNLILRKEIIPQVDLVLISMLGNEVGIEKTLIDANPIYVQEKGIKYIEFSLEYTIADFLAPEAPDKAIEEDENNLRDALRREDFILKNLKIDTNTGKLSFIYSVDLERG